MMNGGIFFFRKCLPIFHDYVHDSAPEEAELVTLVYNNRVDKFKAMFESYTFGGYR